MNQQEANILIDLYRAAVKDLNTKQGNTAARLRFETIKDVCEHLGIQIEGNKNNA